MREFTVTGYSLPDAYHEALLCLDSYGDITDCADWNTTQKEVSMTMIVTNPMAEPMISKMFIGGPKELEQYKQEMLDGILDFEVERGNWDYTYHDRMVHYVTIKTVDDLKVVEYVDQIEFVIQELQRNPSSRRAVIVIRDVGTDAGSADPACAQHIQYFIRNGKLDCKVLFRSNDACKATFMNSFALICLQERIANELGVSVGQYVHRANSFHCYEKDFDMLAGYTRRIKDSKDADDLCFYYKDGWDEDMADAREEIAAQVEELKRR